jgi:lipopolysaccharide transport system permease protein
MTGSQIPPVTAVYTPESRLRHPGVLFGEMFRDLMASRELAWRLFVRDISARYRQTLLGYFWAFFPPIVTTAVFVFLRRSGFFTVGDTQVPYAVFLLTGLVLWQMFTDAVNAPLRMVNQSRAMLAKINFPREALILAGIAEVLFNFMVRGILLVAVLLWFRQLPAVTALIAPIGLLGIVGMGLAIGIVLVPVGILYKDVERALGVVISLWMFLTPVLYPPPDSWPGSLTMVLNPVSPVLDTTRAWLLTGSPQHLGGFGVVAVSTGIVLLAGWTLYRLALPILIERMSA